MKFVIREFNSLDPPIDELLCGGCDRDAEAAALDCR